MLKRCWQPVAQAGASIAIGLVGAALANGCFFGLGTWVMSEARGLAPLAGLVLLPAVCWAAGGVAGVTLRALPFVDGTFALLKATLATPAWYVVAYRVVTALDDDPRDLQQPFLVILAVVMIVPSWIATIVSFWLSGRFFKRHSPGCCRHCDYDLTGNVSGVCPECGAPISTGAATAAPVKEDSPS